MATIVGFLDTERQWVELKPISFGMPSNFPGYGKILVIAYKYFVPMVITGKDDDNVSLGIALDRKVDNIEIIQ